MPWHVIQIRLKMLDTYLYLQLHILRNRCSIDHSINLQDSILNQQIIQLYIWIREEKSRARIFSTTYSWLINDSEGRWRGEQVYPFSTLETKLVNNMTQYASIEVNIIGEGPSNWFYKLQQPVLYAVYGIIGLNFFTIRLSILFMRVRFMRLKRTTPSSVGNKKVLVPEFAELNSSDLTIVGSNCAKLVGFLLYRQIRALSLA